MSDHSPEPWKFTKNHVVDANDCNVAWVRGGTREAANKALILAAPAMKRELQDTLGYLQSHTHPRRRWESILAVLATTEPAELLTLLELCKLILACETLTTKTRGLLADAVAAEEARDADAKTT